MTSVSTRLLPLYSALLSSIARALLHKALNNATLNSQHRDRRVSVYSSAETVCLRRIPLDHCLRMSLAGLEINECRR